MSWQQYAGRHPFEVLYVQRSYDVGAEVTLSILRVEGRFEVRSGAMSTTVSPTDSLVGVFDSVDEAQRCLDNERDGWDEWMKKWS